MSGMDYVSNEEFQRILIWGLANCEDLTQEEIAEHPLVRGSQPSVSRTLDQYSPVTDGFEFAAKGTGDVDDYDDEFLADRREAVVEAVETSPLLSTAIGMAKVQNSED